MLQIHNLILNYGTKNILKEISFQIEENKIIGLIGVNGSGKSSLLKVVSGEVEIDWGQIYTKGAVSVAYLSQDPKKDILKWTQKPILNWYIKKQNFGAGNINNNLVDEINEEIDLATILKLDFDQTKPVKTLEDLITIQKSFLLDQYKYFSFTDKELISKENEFIQNIKFYKQKFSFNLDLNNTSLENLSGGQMRKLGLILVLSTNSNILLLDEPTNHLDLENITKLEEIIKSQTNKSIIFVSHDRYFTDNLAQTMWEIDEKKIFIHKGNYTQFLNHKNTKNKQLKTEIWKKEQYLKRELEWVNAGVKARGTKDKGRLDNFTTQNQELDNLKAKQKTKLNIILPQFPRLGSKILEAKNSSLTVKNTEKTLWKNLYFNLQKNDKIGLLGSNGCGKSTLLKFITQNLDFDNYLISGKFNIGLNTTFLYFDQHKEIENIEQTPFEFIGHGREYITYGINSSKKELSTRHYLKLWLFDKEKYNTPIKNLSGGEVSRLLLAKLFLTPANVFILDEPTNDLDLETMLVLEQALIDFEGVVILISHDRSFLNKVCNQIWYFDVENQEINILNGNYELVKNFFEKSSFNENIELSEDKSSISTLNKNPNSMKKLNQQISKLENQITKQEKVVFDLEQKFTDPEIFKDAIRLEKIQNHLKREKMVLNQLMESWEQILNQV